MKKGYKVTDRHRKKMVGVGCESLRELLEKGSQKLNMNGLVTAALDDGTIVDDEDYFQALPPQSILILYREDEEITTGVDLVLDALRRVNDTYLKTGLKARELLLTKTRELMQILIAPEKENLSKNTREEDPDWFEGLDTNAKTKDDFMNRRSQDRIRGYFYKFQEDVRKTETYLKDASSRRTIQQCVQYFKDRLKADGYFGCYFDRRCATATANQDLTQPRKRLKVTQPVLGHFTDDYDKFSYCDLSGNFTCQGKWQFQECEFSSEHRINPYSSRKARILFSTWNLDHRIEKSRCVLPALLEAIENRPRFRSVNFLYFYQLMFTKMNLKLVHIVCHDKAGHGLTCDAKALYT